MLAPFIPREPLAGVKAGGPLKRDPRRRSRAERTIFWIAVLILRPKAMHDEPEAGARVALASRAGGRRRSAEARRPGEGEHIEIEVARCATTGRRGARRRMPRLCGSRSGIRVVPLRIGGGFLVGTMVENAIISGRGRRAGRGDRREAQDQTKTQATLRAPQDRAEEAARHPHIFSQGRAILQFGAKASIRSSPTMHHSMPNVSPMPPKSFEIE